MAKAVVVSSPGPTPGSKGWKSEPRAAGQPEDVEKTNRTVGSELIRPGLLHPSSGPELTPCPELGQPVRK